ncbi:undecaprenyl-diphosphate phosphatase [Mesorhizobium sp. B2-4-19]|uniref:undecaprenyl-diphosphate phosphatase n=1 Tax=Mesorhizobium sp. B2-4-19 TaxID=2589930 RepID=UPI0011287580|nr:undecaprenyl-diphosphate phosphatase [Mesorhizobium sp. B2-4-19]TPK54856.1 undecaprenyl-diphosphate phosphatase [Mesorhizobium sp. B2-4-19]
MISYFQAVVLGLLQGVSELFPISSLGHTVLVPPFLKWHIDQSNDGFLAFVVLTHFATALVLLGFFWRDWLAIVTGIFRSLAMREIKPEDTYARLGWLLIVSTIPAGLLGLLFEQKLRLLFAAPTAVSLALACNGLVLYGIERMRSRRVEEGPHDDGKLAALSWTEATIIGLAQCFALIPGFSRTGLSMAGGLGAGLSHENAIRYSFLLATPIIFAAAVLKVPDLFTTDGPGVIGQAFVGALCAAFSAYFSVRFLLKYFETRTLTPFAVYCVAAGLLAFAIFSF